MIYDSGNTPTKTKFFGRRAGKVLRALSDFKVLKNQPSLKENTLTFRFNHPQQNLSIGKEIYRHETCMLMGKQRIFSRHHFCYLSTRSGPH